MGEAMFGDPAAVYAVAAQLVRADPAWLTPLLDELAEVVGIAHGLDRLGAGPAGSDPGTVQLLVEWRRTGRCLPRGAWSAVPLGALTVNAVAGDTAVVAFFEPTDRHRSLDAERHVLAAVAELLASGLERRARGLALEQRIAELSLVAELSSDVIVRLDRDGVVRYLSPSALRVFRVPVHGLLGRTWDEVRQHVEPSAVVEARSGDDGLPSVVVIHPAAAARS